jgi:hypothetical protein
MLLRRATVHRETILPFLTSPQLEEDSVGHKPTMAATVVRVAATALVPQELEQQDRVMMAAPLCPTHRAVAVLAQLGVTAVVQVATGATVLLLLLQAHPPLVQVAAQAAV